MRIDRIHYYIPLLNSTLLGLLQARVSEDRLKAPKANVKACNAFKQNSTIRMISSSN